MINDTACLTLASKQAIRKRGPPSIPEPKPWMRIYSIILQVVIKDDKENQQR